MGPYPTLLPVEDKSILTRRRGRTMSRPTPVATAPAAAAAPRHSTLPLPSTTPVAASGAGPAAAKTLRERAASAGSLPSPSVRPCVSLGAIAAVHSAVVVSRRRWTPKTALKMPPCASIGCNACAVCWRRFALPALGLFRHPLRRGFFTILRNSCTTASVTL